MMKKTYQILATVALSLTMAGGLYAQSTPDAALFGITFARNELVSVNPDTGAARIVGALGAEAASYGVAMLNGRLYAFDQMTNRIREINKISGEFTRNIDIGVSGLKGEGDLTFRASDGVGFLASALNANDEPVNDFYAFLIQDDSDVAVAVRVGSTGVAIDAMAFSANGTLYGIGQVSATLYTINPDTGATTPVGPLNVSMNSPVAGMTFGRQIATPARVSPNGSAVAETLYASIDDRLYTIDTTSGAATPVSTDVINFGPFISSVSGLAFAPGAGTLGNMAGRLFVGVDENVGIAGFIIRGTPNKMVLVRGTGPSLTKVPGALADPVLELFDGQGKSIATNDNWRDSPEATQIAATGLAPGNDKEAAILRTLPAGTYTAILRGANRTTGIGLVELYDVDVGSGSRLANLSTRGSVQGGDNVLIGGIIVSGSAPQRVVVRAIGPDLANRNVNNVLADPTLEVFDGNGTSIKTNDNWMTDPDAAEIMSQGLAPANSLESATIVEFAPGSYTAVVKGTNGGTGVALVESFNLTTEPLNAHQ